MKANEAQAWRDDLLSALPEGTSLHGDAPSARFVYLPPSHLKALRPDATVVVGMRGAGKSFWWAALQQPEVRTLLAGADARNPHADLDQTGVVAGFGEALDSEASPDRDTRDLEDLGIFLSMEDGGINVPDVFRVGYGLGRRGGVKPVHSRSAE